MKILAFTDVHGYDKALRSLKAKSKRSRPDLVLCAGDFTVFEHNMENILRKINSLGKTVFLIHGNHESESKVRRLCRKFRNISFIHKRIVSFGGVLFLGWGGGGFSFSDKSFEDFVRKNKAKINAAEKVVFMTHAPPYGTSLDFLEYSKAHVGNKSFTRFIKSHKNVVLAISGHLHENEGKKDKLNSAVLSNPGLFGRIFKV
ncbi:hypothetical protein DRJ22_03420 [Candidatus Woesearchaeota archaeon]|nr:MAG: hypothetical protein DRJ22_03420 [Candidatus Woesearchaeota archaeon]